MRISTLVFAVVAAFGIAGVASAQSLGSAITYQGMFADGGSPANGTYDFEFALYSVASGGTAVQTVSKADVAVSGGLINTPVDFGAATYDGQVKWVEVHVRPGASTGAYTVLNPRQALTAAPYAMGLPMPFQRSVATGNATAFQIDATQSGTAIAGSVPAFSGNPAVHGSALGAVGIGVQGDSPGTGVFGQSTSNDGIGVNGENTLGTAVRGKTSGTGDGVRGISEHGIGIHGFGAYAGVFEGAVNVLDQLGVVSNITCNFGGSCAAVLSISNPSVGNLIRGTTAGNDVLRVDGNGKVFADGGFQASGADLAEHVPATGTIEAGDVVEIDADSSATLHVSSQANSTSVAGVVSTRPGVTLNGPVSEDAKSDAMPRLALSGRVPVKASAENGAIRAGDLLVSSSRPGRAMRAPESPRAGTVIGKAMQKLDGDSGEIEMLVMLR